ncbi:hypothetical protein [Photobacterium damselae]|uniref:hypothetical protein n=1 Tax=Photobacterium damselae TaxID=38293 RepID=UPI004068D656
MTLTKQYSIATRQQRSTRIDSDLSPEFFHSLVYHGTAQSTLETLFRQYSQAGQNAFTLTGPYGSGKSTVALLLTGLLHESPKMRDAAFEVISKESKVLFDKSIHYSKGWFQIRAVGGVNKPVITFWNATLNALLDHSETKQLHNKYSKIHVENESQLIKTWELLFNEIEPLVDGILLLADEMGKSLEYINKNNGELHLFQDLAEVLGRINTPVIFMGLLHQAFSEYAKDRGTKLQEEWGKIQGRYHNIHYNVSTDETVALIASSISNTTLIDNSNDRLVEQVLNALGNDNSTRKKQLKQRLEQCIPLHPLTALILGPISKRRFSQNERSTFSFLNSHEQNSFQMFLEDNEDLNARYTPEQLWNYLETNLEHAILGSPDGHGWAEAVESIRQAINKRVPEKAIEVLKSIAIISLFGKPANLSATDEMLLAACNISSKEELNKYLQSLKNASCIIYRKHQSSWVVFEGSDLDIPSLIDEKIEQQGTSNEAINHLLFSKQEIAKGYYHEIGTLRWAEQSISSHFNDEFAKSLITKRKGEFANMVLLLNPINEEELQRFSKLYPSLILANAKSSDDITAIAKELYALELIKTDSKIGAELQHDNVALKEYNGRLINAKIAFENAIQDAFNHADWYALGNVNRCKTLSHIVSDIAYKIFDATPVIKNELVNRNKLSGTAVSAQKKLLVAMLNKGKEENLEINGYPPEMSMYISCLKNTGIHTAEADNGKHWHHDENIEPRLNALFDAARSFIIERADKNVYLSEIIELWNNAPYGVTLGVAPIFLFAFLKSCGDDIAFYEKTMSGDFEFISEPDIDYVHKIQKSPKELAVKFIKLEDKDKEWLQLLASYAATLTTRSVTTNLVSVATPFVTTMHGLSHWVKNANNLVHDDSSFNKKILCLRDTFLQANDPHELLINKIVQVIDPENKMTFIERVNDIEKCVTILKAAHEKMLSNMNSKIKQLFPETGEDLIEMCKIVEEKSGDLRLKSFARELGKSQEFGLKWLESLIAVVVGRGIQNWNETNLLTAEQKISDYAQDFLRIVKASQSKSSSTTQNEIETKNISLVLEEQNGLVNYTKEIKLTNSPTAQETMNAIQLELTALSEFERIDVLHQLLKEALVAQN